MTVDVEHWRAVIKAAPDRRSARVTLGCKARELKAFREQHMPDHLWPNTKTGEDVAREKHLQRINKRAEAGKGPAPEEVEEAVAKLTAQLRRVMKEFVPGTRNRELESEYSELARMRLLTAIPRTPPGKMSMWFDGFGYTDLGRAVQVYLKKTS
jgi:hypothetical protein